MKAGGKTTDIGVGRKILCKEKPGTRVKSQCAKNVTKTVKAAKKGLTPAQQKLWRKYVYTSALLQARRYCDVKSKGFQFGSAVPGRAPGRAGGSSRSSTVAQRYKACTNKVLSGSPKFKGLFGKQFKWSDYLIKGAAVIKKLLPKSIFGKDNPYK